MRNTAQNITIAIRGVKNMIILLLLYIVKYSGNKVCGVLTTTTLDCHFFKHAVFIGEIILMPFIIALNAIDFDGIKVRN
jgi:hypothetical protein